MVDVWDFIHALICFAGSCGFSYSGTELGLVHEETALASNRKPEGLNPKPETLDSFKPETLNSFKP